MTGTHDIAGAKRVVVKVGSALLVDTDGTLHSRWLGSLARDIAGFRRRGQDVILVSSGAVALGRRYLGLKSGGLKLEEKQAAAAAGMVRLAHAYQERLGEHQLTVAQILLTLADTEDRRRYLNARSTLMTLLGVGAVPLINENDTVATDEIRFGDNDTLGALVANLLEADALVLLTDQEGLFDADPRHDPEARLIAEGRADDPALAAVAGDGGALGRGGMATKVRAARLAARSGALTAIASGRQSEVLTRLMQGETLGTLLMPDHAPLAARKRWLAGQLQVRGTLVLDAGAVKVLREHGSSLLPVGVRRVEGEFKRGDMLVCVDEQGQRIAKGLVNYGSDEARRIMGQPSRRIEELLGYMESPELIHRDNLVIV